jgi:photosystem II stability/assembly factor-like uncharacterized protein
LLSSGHAHSLSGKIHPSTPVGKPRVISIPLFFLLLFSITGTGLSQKAWETVAGGPAIEHSPLCVAVIDSAYAVVGGWGGRIFRTTDGGNTWLTSPSGSTDNFEAVAFSDRVHGMLVGGTQGTILRTDDGGESWRSRTSALFDTINSFGSVALSDPLNGVVTTFDPNKIFHTSDGGRTWTAATAVLFGGIRRVRLRGPYGIAVGYVGHTYRTTDGGRSWFFHSGMTGGRALRDVSMKDSLNAIAVGDEGTIRRTTDGGIFWTNVSSGTTLHLQSIDFSDDMHGIIGTDGGMVLRTTDGGLSWSAPAPTPMNTVWDLGFGSPSFGLAVTRFDGQIFRTTDAGAVWEPLEYSWRGCYYGVGVLNADSLFGVGEGGRIAFSEDYGRSWTAQPVPVNSTLRNVDFSDPLHGWVVGDSGVILRTSNAGADWVVQPANTNEKLLAVAAPDPDIGIVAGENNTILRTGDGGSTWTEHPGPVSDDWVALSFLTPEVGVAAGRGGLIIRTSDGGKSWNLLKSAAGLVSIQYIDAGHIYAVGRLTADSAQWLITTADDGLNWSARALPGPGTAGAAFANPGFGWVAGTGGIGSTEDSGKVWTTYQPSMASFNAVSMAGPRAAFAVGDSGVVARMRNNGSITGILFFDRNNDSLRNPGEGGIGGRRMYLDGPFADSTLTAPDGFYSFPSLPHGSYSVRSQFTLFWEQTTPLLLSMDTLRITDHAEQLIHPLFGLAGPFVRLRIPILVSDNTLFAHRYVWAGIRPGTTRGIWGAYPLASPADSAEGEAELPPRSFAKFGGIFDARFSDPYVPLNVSSEIFGEGSWTDMKPYTSPSQRDTFFMSFLPGYNNGGDYPITIRWDTEMLSQMFTGGVSLVNPFGGTTNMKSTGSLTITSNAIEALTLITNSPNFPGAWLPNWHLVSLPAPVVDGSVASLFPSAATPGYSFTPGVGYVGGDTLRPGAGYWLKYATGVDSITFDPAARLADTIIVVSGWNLIGALSAPVAVNSVTTSPEGLIPGYFYGYDGAYTAVDTLDPGGAYWVRSEGDGVLFLNAGTPGGRTPGSARSRFDIPPAGLTGLRITDADANVAGLYFSADQTVDPERYLLPPRPPEGVFDVRYGSGRSLEMAPPGTLREFPVVISSARFPLRISLTEKNATDVSVMVGGKILPVPRGAGLTIPNAGAVRNTGNGGRYVMTLVVTGTRGIPAEYGLSQNYPNPFNPATRISYALPVASRVNIRIYDLLGRVVATLFDDVAQAGYRSVEWDAGGVASGVYFYRLDAVSLADPGQSFSGVKKLIVLR